MENHPAAALIQKEKKKDEVGFSKESLFSW